jgi:TRAP transporter 4TM/12TM fusion protein
MTEEASPEPRFRRHKGVLGSIEKALLICIPLAGVVGILDVFLYFGISVYIQQYLAVLLGLVLALVPLLVPAAKSSPRERLPWYDAAISLGGLVIGLYMVIFYPSIAVSMGILTPDRIILGALAIVLVLESCRRLLGWPLVIIVAFFIFYAHFTNIFPGALYGRGVPLPRLATYLYVDENALFSIAMRVTGTIVLAFIFFGRAIFATGGGQFLTNLAMSIMGGFRGGPAKVSVIASSSFGMMSGSAVANVATTGVVTIPLMKKSGYPSYYAGAVEATASSGGQIMPPVMGAAAFLMAQFLGMPYAKVVVAAIVPAVLYYVGVFVQVDLEAVKSNLKGLPRNLLPSLKKTLLDGWLFFIPLIVLVYSLFVLFLDPDSAGLYSVASVLVVTAVRKASRINLRKLLAILEDTGEGLLEITVIAAAAGLILGVVSLTGLGFAFSLALIQMSGGNLFILLLLAAAGAIVLGMGMTVTAAYILVVILIAPALVQLGIIPIVAHMFVFYFAILSFLTPPICLAAYTGASIAGSKPMQTAWQSMRLGVAAYIVPFIFAYSPALLLIGSPAEIIRAIISGLMGMVLIAIGLEGYLFRHLGWFQRILSFGGGIGLMAPFWLSKGIGVALLLALLLQQWTANRLARAKRTDNLVDSSNLSREMGEKVQN